MSHRYSSLDVGGVSGIGKPSQPQPQTSPEAFRAGRAARPNDIFIAVLGITGSGKSSFIWQCTGGQSTDIGHPLEARTTAVRAYPYNISGDRTVYLIDTPGFDSTNRSDTEVLSEIATWLADSYQSGIRLHGIIFLHRITDNRLQGSAKRIMMMCRELCGTDAVKRVYFITTMWDKVMPGDTAAATAREDSLLGMHDVWRRIVPQSILRFRSHSTVSPARDIVNALASYQEPVVMELQRQLVDEHMPLGETGAGRVLDADMQREKDTWTQQRLQMERDIENATAERDLLVEQGRREERDKYMAKIEMMVENTNRSQEAMGRLLADADQRVARLETKLREQRAAHLEEVRQLNSNTQQHREEQDRLLAMKESEAQRQKQEMDELKGRLERLSTAAKLSGGAEESMAMDGEVVDSPSTFSVALHGTLAACLNPGGIQGIWMSEPVGVKRTRGRALLKAVSFGRTADRLRTTWIAEYCDGTWEMSSGLDASHPHLNSKIQAHGLNNLEYCSIGPDSCYYARWKNGRACWEVPSDLNKWLHERAAEPDSVAIRAVSFGRDDAWIVKFTRASTPLICSRRVLRGHYKGLDQFINNPNRPSNLSVDAIALDPWSTRDFILGYHFSDDPEIKFHWVCSNQVIDSGINNWAAASKRARGGSTGPLRR